MKRIFLFALVLCFFVACKGTHRIEDLDLDALANLLVESDSFSDGLEMLEAENLEYFYTLCNVNSEDIVKGVAYHSDGDTAEEFLLLEAIDEEAATRLHTALETRVADQINVYSAYNPEEAPKLENAYLEKLGIYVIYCVSADNDATNSIIEDFVK